MNSWTWMCPPIRSRRTFYETTNTAEKKEKKRWILSTEHMHTGCQKSLWRRKRAQYINSRADWSLGKINSTKFYGASERKKRKERLPIDLLPSRLLHPSSTIQSSNSNFWIIKSLVHINNARGIFSDKRWRRVSNQCLMKWIGILFFWKETQKSKRPSLCAGIRYQSKDATKVSSSAYAYTK